MTEIIPTIRGACDASPNRSEPCIVFAEAVQTLERLLQADTWAEGLPHGDCAYGDGPQAADAVFEAALWAAERASYSAGQSAYRAASDLMIYALRATTGDEVRTAVMCFERLVRDEIVTSDRTIRLSLVRSYSVLDDLATLWDRREAAEIEAFDPYQEALEDWLADEDFHLTMPGC